MSIGNHTSWIIVDLHTARALTPTDDQRRTIQFHTREAANIALHSVLTAERVKANRNAAAYDTGRYLVVELPN